MPALVTDSDDFGNPPLNNQPKLGLFFSLIPKEGLADLPEVGAPPPVLGGEVPITAAPSPSSVVDFSFSSLRSLVDAHVAATKRLFEAKKRHLVKKLGLQFASSVCDDLFQALQQAGLGELILAFHGSYSGANGATVGSHTHRMIKARMMPHNLAGLFTDLFAVVVKVCKDFKASGGSSLYHKPSKALVASSEWQDCVKCSKLVHFEVCRIISHSGRSAMSVVLSPDVLDRLQDAQCPMPDGTFCFTLHPSSVNEGAAKVQCAKLADPSKKLEDA
jgi:hypothetical protein